MRTLRNRVVGLMILAIVTVVGLATLAVGLTLRPPRAEATLEPVARQLTQLRTIARDDPETARAAGLRLADAPPAAADPRVSALLSGALERAGGGSDARVVLTDGPPEAVAVAFVAVGDGTWLVAEIPHFPPPPGRWYALAGWILLIVLGSAAVSLYAATKITRPLRMVEDAVGAMRPDGVLPVIPEDGPHEVRLMARALNRLSSQLCAAVESRMRLVAAAGHDLRTPMTRMRLRAEFIDDPEEREKWLLDLAELELIADSAMRLVREEAGEGVTETLRLDRIAGEVVEELAMVGAKVAAEGLDPAIVAARPMALKRALRNIVTNAATHGGGAVLSVERAGGEAVLTVADRGPGIPEELIERAFEPFFRVDPARRKSAPGAGLGLAIAKEIVERFDGRIALANRAGGGLVQTIRLPIAAETLSPPFASSAEPVSGRG